MSKAILNKLLFSIFIGFLLFIPLSMTLHASDAKDIDEGIILNIGYPSSAFSEGYLKDAQSALEVWGNKLAKRSIQEIKGVRVTVFKDSDFSDIYNALSRQEIDLLIMNTLDYIDYVNTGMMEPVFVGLSGKEVGKKYILLVRRDKHITSVHQMQNETIYIETEGVGRMPIVWLEVLLQNKGLTDVSTFFRKKIFLEKASQAILPVFFGNVTACITNERAFKIMAELNPQLERELMVVAESQPFLRGLVIYRKDLAQNIKSSLSEALQTMHENAEGQQILMIMREQQLIPYKPEYINNVTTLHQDYQKIQQKKNAKR